MTKAKVKPPLDDKTGTPSADGREVRLQGDTEDERKSAIAGVISSSHLSAARIVIGYNAGTNIDLMAACDVLTGHQKELKDGDLSRAESMLMNQAVALQSIFVDLALRAKQQTGLSQLQTLTGLALKAQSGCRATLQALGELKYPRQATFVKQANISNGPQQVNNGTPPKALTNQYAQARTHAEQIKPEQNKLLEENYGQPGQRMDARAAQTTKRSHPAVAAVEKFHRAKKPGG